MRRDMRREVLKKYRGLYERAMTGKSRRAAMRSFCLECCYWQIKEVQKCGDDGCPLFPYRPQSRSTPEHSNARTSQPENAIASQRYYDKGAET
jgi:hypothetical protein